MKACNEGRSRVGPDWGLGHPPQRGDFGHRGFGLGFIDERIVPALCGWIDRRRSTFLAGTMSVVVLLAALLHGLEEIACRRPGVTTAPDLRLAFENPPC